MQLIQLTSPVHFSNSVWLSPQNSQCILFLQPHAFATPGETELATVMFTCAHWHVLTKWDKLTENGFDLRSQRFSVSLSHFIVSTRRLAQLCTYRDQFTLTPECPQSVRLPVRKSTVLISVKLVGNSIQDPSTHKWLKNFASCSCERNWSQLVFD